MFTYRLLLLPLVLITVTSTAAKSRKCYPLPEIIVKLLLRQVKLYYFYSGSASDRKVVTLPKSLDLLKDSHWKQDRPIAVYTFGWLNTPTNGYSQQIIKAYHSNGSYNLLVVDWALAGTLLDYLNAVTMVPRVGIAVAQALQRMLDAGATLHHLVGHSLGAHVSGFIGRNLKSRPSLIAGLDPAGPLFDPGFIRCQDPLTSNDADYVLALHTDKANLGSNQLTGQSDFMANTGAKIQPGCSFLNTDKLIPACSHFRAIELWSEAVTNSSSILGRLCPSYKNFTDGLCGSNSISRLAAPDRNLSGVFYFTTNAKMPFARGEQGL